jgi:hypothetical protein
MVEQLGTLSYLEFHHVQLFANAAGRVIQQQIQ